MSSMSTLRAQAVSPHRDGVSHQTSRRLRRTIITPANSLQMREAGSLIGGPVTYDHAPPSIPVRALPSPAIRQLRQPALASAQAEEDPAPAAYPGSPAVCARRRKTA
jgi:hypothetical protein